jgi:predicted nucleic acid-binding protein
LILVDRSVWIDHLQHGDAILAASLERSQVLAHPFVIGELALGSLRQRETIIGALRDLPRALMAQDDEALAFIERWDLHGRGIGYVDVHLLASARLGGDARLWTRDKRLAAVADELGLAADLA